VGGREKNVLPAGGVESVAVKKMVRGKADGEPLDVSEVPLAARRGTEKKAPYSKQASVR